MRILEDTLCPKILFTAILFKKLLDHKLFGKKFDHKPFEKMLERNRCAGLSRCHVDF
jgi:patatin-like phospholipase/acyl hydrolase